jgi:Undecaprenyl-phosphate galactose phosphotransferase WbaP
MTVALDINEHDIKSFEGGLLAPADVPQGINGHGKRAIDIAIAMAVLVFTLPLLVTVAALIWLQDRGPVFFRQTRCGRGGKPFTCYKFRTMKIDALAALQEVLITDPKAAAEWERDQKLKRDPRVTWIGKFLRKSSLDELPQLFNILRGDMSIIGPRPVTYDELPRYGNKLAYYTATRPGVTGLWQVNGRNLLSYQERVEYDAQYVKNWTAAQDIKILVKTVPAVLLAKGAF